MHYSRFMGRTEEELHRRALELEQRGFEQRAQVAAYGIDLAKRRAIDLTFWAPDEPTARKFVEALTRNEFQVTLVLGPARASEPDQRWVVRTALFASVDFVTTRDNLATFLLFADKYDCEYDGWGTAIVEAAQQPPVA
jgi:hypothetical protein